MIDQDFTESLLGKFENLSKRHHEDCLTIECSASDIFDKIRADTVGIKIVFFLTLIFKWEYGYR